MSFSLLLVLPAGFALLFALLPSRVNGQHPLAIGKVLSWLFPLQFALALAGLCISSFSASGLSTASQMEAVQGISSGSFLQLDRLGCAFLLLVSFLGWVVIRYSANYLRGEHRQGQFLSLMGATLGALCLLCVSANLVAFSVFWSLAGIGVARLMAFYGDRQQAREAARMNFIFGRIGDAFLLTVLLLLASEGGSWNFDWLNQYADDLPRGHALTAFLIVAAICTKSIQFPFHTWLTGATESPTPVSALLHAGFVNAGGLLVLRLNGFLATFPNVLGILALIGAGTVMVGVLTYLSESSVKRRLAHSTVAQIGFMMVQLGVGAWGPAMVHLFAHSLYKAHAFLSSGSELDAKRAGRTLQTSSREEGTRLQSLPVYLLAALGVVALVAGSFPLFGITFWNEAGGWLLVGIATLAFVGAVWRALIGGEQKLVATTFLAIPVLTALYALGFHVALWAMAGAAHEPLVATNFAIFVQIAAGLGFVTLFAWLWMRENGTMPRQLQAFEQYFYVQAVNGFYLHHLWRSLLISQTR